MGILETAMMRLGAVVVVCGGLVTSAAAQAAKPLSKCAPDAVVAGTVCIDKYEASVWRVPLPATANKSLVKKIQQGKVKVADLAKGGATQLGVSSDDYAPCADSGQNCTNDVYAVSVPGVVPATHLTWFQAQAACKNARKRLPTSPEWQAAVIGTPDPGADDGVTDCNSTWQHDGSDPAPTGSRSECVSADGAFDMVGNVYEFAAEWVTGTTGCGSWNESVSPTGDSQCLAGASTVGEPSTLLRGGSFMDNQNAGPLLIGGGNGPSWSGFMAGFRCAR